MKKNLKKIKVPSSLLILLAIFAIAIFGFQISKIYAQTSSLSSSLQVGASATIGGPLNVSGGMGVGTTNPPSNGLSVSGASNFDGLVSVNTPGETQTNSIANVAYIDAKIASLPLCPVCESDPPPPGDGGECVQWEDFGAPCDGPMPSASIGWVCPDDLRFGGYIANSCDRIQDRYWRLQCCPFPTLPR